MELCQRCHILISMRQDEGGYYRDKPYCTECLDCMDGK